jgi:hypothetical protein
MTPAADPGKASGWYSDRAPGQRGQPPALTDVAGMKPAYGKPDQLGSKPRSQERGLWVVRIF